MYFPKHVFYEEKNNTASSVGINAFGENVSLSNEVGVESSLVELGIKQQTRFVQVLRNGITINEKDQDKWNEEFNKLFDSIPDDTLLSLYDCHI